MLAFSPRTEKCIRLGPYMSPHTLVLSSQARNKQDDGRIVFGTLDNQTFINKLLYGFEEKI